MQQKGLLFDHLIGAALDRLRHGNSERPSGLKVYDQFDFRSLLHRKVSGFLAIENTADIVASKMVGLCEAGSIASQAA